MSKRVLTVLFLCGLLSAAVLSAQQANDLLFHRSTAGSAEYLHHALRLGAAPAPTAPMPPTLVFDPQGLQPTTAQLAAVQASLQWAVQHGYLFDVDAQVVNVSISSNGISITYDVPGGPDVTIILSNGPIIIGPDRTEWLMNALVIRDISNGF